MTTHGGVISGFAHGRFFDFCPATCATIHAQPPRGAHAQLSTVPESASGGTASRRLRIAAPNLQLIDLARGLVLVRSGDLPTRAYFPISGVIASCVTLRDGRLVEARIVGREGTLGAAKGAGERTSFTSAVVRLEGKAFTIDYGNLETFMDRSPAFRALLARHDALQLAMADQSVACNAAHSAEQRLARRLLRLRRQSDDDKLTVTQDVLAEMLGVQRNSVSQVAHAMQARNLIRYSRGALELSISARYACNPASATTPW
jgi:CRP-like cAMP-binding protein